VIPDLEHALRNHLAIILGFAELLMHEVPADDPRLGDYREIHKAATAALRLIAESSDDRR
jgi:hypothetical protein